MTLRPVVAAVALSLLGFAAVPVGLNAWQAFGARRARLAEAEAQAQAGAAAAAAGDLERAVVAFRAAAHLDPDSAERRLALLRARARLLTEQPESIGSAEGAGELVHALRLALERGAAEDLATDDGGRFLLAVALLEQARGRAAEATAAYDKALAAAPELALAWHRKGMMLLGAGNAIDAELPLRRATELAPGDWRFHQALGQCHAARSDWARAAISHRAAVDLHASFETLRALGRAQVGLEQFDGAVDSLDRARRMLPAGRSPAVDGLAADLGTALFRSLRVREAVPYLQAALAAERSAANLLGLGLALAHLEAHEQAAAHFEEAIGLDRMLDQAHERLVVSLVKSGQVAVARAALARFFKLAGGDTRFAGRMAEMRRLEGEVAALLGEAGPVNPEAAPAP